MAFPLYIQQIFYLDEDDRNTEDNPEDPDEELKDRMGSNIAVTYM